MYIYLTCKSAITSFEVGESFNERREHVYFSVELDYSRSRVTLETGERLRDLEGHLHVNRMFSTQSDDDNDRVGLISYVPEYEDTYDGTFSACYEIYLFVPSDLFQSVHQSARHRFLPSITIELPFDLSSDEEPKEGYAGFRFGHSPDGSDKQWDNKQHRTVAIVGYSFRYDHVSGTDDDDLATTSGTVDPARAAINKIGEQVKQIRQYVSWLLAIAIVLFAAYLRDRFF